MIFYKIHELYIYYLICLIKDYNYDYEYEKNEMIFVSKHIK